MMMTKQTQLKKQAYESSLKSRALSVLIYLIDRSNKELTCFPSISTMAEQLHISVSTVKRALRELEAAGYLKKDSRYRSNQGQTSNLYTLVLRESPAGLDLAAGEEPVGAEGEEAIHGDSNEEIEHVTFETLKLEGYEKKKNTEFEGGKYQGNQENEDNRVAKYWSRLQRWRRRRDVHSAQRRTVKLTFGWTGEGVSLHPP